MVGIAAMTESSAHEARGTFDFRAEASIVDAWLQPVANSPDGCGKDLAHEDPRFAEMELVLEGRHDDQGKVVRSVDWDEVARLAEELLKDTRDLRVAVLWTRARVRKEQYAGLADGLKLITGLLDKFWDGLHPTPAPGEDATIRKNALLPLGQPAQLISDVKQSAIIKAGQADVINVAMAVASFPSDDPPGNGPHRDQLEVAVAEAVKNNPALARVGSRNFFWVEELQKVLALRFAKMVPELGSLPDWVGKVEELFPILGAENRVKKEPTSGGGEGRPVAGDIGKVNSRQDAIRVIDAVCSYLDKAEPSNPAQFLLRRARSMLDRNFLELLKDIAPSAFSDVARTMGVDPNVFGSQVIEVDRSGSTERQGAPSASGGGGVFKPKPK